jgi:hypothetical protein
MPHASEPFNRTEEKNCQIMGQNRPDPPGVNGHSLGFEALCRAMFIEGARVLGFALEARIPIDAQERIQQAADLLAQKLAVLIDIQRDALVNSEIED